MAVKLRSLRSRGPAQRPKTMRQPNGVFSWRTWRVYQGLNLGWKKNAGNKNRKEKKHTFKNPHPGFFRGNEFSMRIARMVKILELQKTLKKDGIFFGTNDLRYLNQREISVDFLRCFLLSCLSKKRLAMSIFVGKKMQRKKRYIILILI